MEYAIQQVDNQLADLMPALGRRACTPRVMEEADRLLDTRNYLMDIMREIAYDDLERMMTNGD
jgi:hypothetical protein